MILYLDTSALVKLLLREVRSDETIATFEAAELVASSHITYAEACAALARNDRRRGASAKQLGREIDALDAFWRDFTRIPVAAVEAGRFALKHSLRGMDAIQLAAASSLRDRLHADGTETLVMLATFDGELNEAAEREGFATLGQALE